MSCRLTMCFQWLMQKQHVMIVLLREMLVEKLLSFIHQKIHGTVERLRVGVEQK